MRRPLSLLTIFAVLSVLALLSLLDASHRNRQASAHIERMAKQAGQLELTDLSLFTEARYTRHPTQADWHSPFQDHPLALEHFPSGSLLRPPASLQAR
jgi:hypothetical protein